MPVSHTNRQPFYLIRHPTKFRLQKAVLSLVRRDQDPENLSYERLLSPLGGQLRQLKLRHSFVPAALELLRDPTSQCSTMGGTQNRAWSGEKTASRLYWRCWPNATGI